MEVQIISEEHIADSMPQVVTGTVVEQIVDVPALQLQEGLAEEIVDSTVPLIKEEIVEVIQPLIALNEHIVRQTEASLLPPIDATIVEVLRPQEHIHEHNVEQTQASTTSQINAKIAE